MLACRIRARLRAIQGRTPIFGRALPASESHPRAHTSKARPMPQILEGRAHRCGGTGNAHGCCRHPGSNGGRDGGLSRSVEGAMGRGARLVATPSTLGPSARTAADARRGGAIIQREQSPATPQPHRGHRSEHPAKTAGGGGQLVKKRRDEGPVDRDAAWRRDHNCRTHKSVPNMRARKPESTTHGCSAQAAGRTSAKAR